MAQPFRAYYAPFMQKLNQIDPLIQQGKFDEVLKRIKSLQQDVDGMQRVADEDDENDFDYMSDLLDVETALNTVQRQITSLSSTVTMTFRKIKSSMR